ERRHRESSCQYWLYLLSGASVLTARPDAIGVHPRTSRRSPRFAIQANGGSTVKYSSEIIAGPKNAPMVAATRKYRFHNRLPRAGQICQRCERGEMRASCV